MVQVAHPPRRVEIEKGNDVQGKRMIFYNVSGGMESAGMLVIELQRIKETSARARFADTGKHFPEMRESIKQIESKLDLSIEILAPRITFDEFLFERGGMIRKGTTDCSRRMKRSTLSKDMKQFPKPWEVNIGFNADEKDRAEAFSDKNERPWLHWRYPLIEHNINRAQSWQICEEAGFSILVSMYRKMGRFDCFWCGNQTDRQALKVVDHYPQLAQEWIQAEARKGHGFRPIPLKVLIDERDRQGLLDFGGQSGCSCFGGDDAFDEEAD